jgi:hypothetical protein
MPSRPRLGANNAGCTPQLRPLITWPAYVVRRPSASSHLKFGCGDIVREPDGRHEARVEQVSHDGIVAVRWLETRWLSAFLPGDLELVRRADRPSTRR